MIAIPNMDKPKNCFQCSFNDGIYCALIDNDTDAFISEDPTKVSTKRLDNCPLIEIVTCGECKWWNRDGKRKDGKGWCENAICGLTKPNAFCSYGERRSE